MIGGFFSFGLIGQLSAKATWGTGPKKLIFAPCIQAVRSDTRSNRNKNESELREIETSFFIASFYSEMYFKKTTYKKSKCHSFSLVRYLIVHLHQNVPPNLWKNEKITLKCKFKCYLNP